MRVDYVVGFLMNRELQLMLLVRKQRPLWQRGLLNGVGGKIETAETALQAMEREFSEETQGCAALPRWRQFLTVNGRCLRSGKVEDTYALQCFYAFTSAAALLNIKTGTRCAPQCAEQVVVEAIGNVTTRNAIPNLPWMLRMALSMEEGEVACSFEITEHYQLCDSCSNVANTARTSHRDLALEGNVCNALIVPRYRCDACAELDERMLPSLP